MSSRDRHDARIGCCVTFSLVYELATRNISFIEIFYRPTGDFDGQLRQRRWLLPLLVLGSARLRPHYPRRYLRARLPAYGRGAHVRHPTAAEEGQAHEDAPDVVPQVKKKTARKERKQQLHQQSKTRNGKTAAITPDIPCNKTCNLHGVNHQIEGM